MKTIVILISTILCCSCATMRTIDPPGNQVNISYFGYDSYCKDIPRVYSGVSHNFCVLYGKPNGYTTNFQKTHFTYLLVDSVVSAAADTLILPYTLVTQTSKGNIKVN
ncbi:YceK/YidQ family lipoprotein [Salinimonas iocasae]|uniref:YceK/YidQ family lipoprotein n=1 Tax=Salinimonas iocasae TaxID=2572577 RepID=A0A5B7YGI6_9ALTE|nr:YceK/YidQ family lipoprotein [Salinimonas iocasae]QCZ94704.1 YceK/YidQ family lipoprotein [Salinimonas iocasae]